MPSLQKALTEVSPWALREVDRLNENSEKEWITQAVKQNEEYWACIRQQWCA